MLNICVITILLKIICCWEFQSQIFYFWLHLILPCASLLNIWRLMILLVITRNATRCNNCNNLLHLSFTLKISIFSEVYIQPIFSQNEKTANPAKTCVQKILRTRICPRKFIKNFLPERRKENLTKQLRFKSRLN